MQCFKKVACYLHIRIMLNTQTILEGHTDEEKGAYLSAIASIATADRQASDEEIDSLTTLCQHAGISEAETKMVLQSASSTNGNELANSLAVLKMSDLKYSLIADLIAFAKADDNYSEEEQHSIQNISSLLEVNENQVTALKQFADKTNSSDITPEDVKKPGFLSSLGIEDKLKNAGINSGGLLQGLLTIAAPLLLTQMFSGRSNKNYGNYNNNRGMFGGRNHSGGFGNVLGGGNFGGGLGSIMNMINGGRGFSNAGGLLSKIFNGTR